MIQPGTIVENKPLVEEVYRCISYNDVAALKPILSNGWEGNGVDVDVIEMRDARQFSVLAYACYKNFEEIFMLLFNHALDKNLKGIKSFDDKMMLLADWANSPTDEEFTALHFATYHGNYTLIKFLMDNAKADIHKRNKFGSSVLHIAAQGDQALPLYYFHKVCGMDINLLDNRSSTPLHWACYSKSEIALNYLLTMNPNLDA
jgi:palmitoyltransferase ZDHHC13/17